MSEQEVALLASETQSHTTGTRPYSASSSSIYIKGSKLEDVMTEALSYPLIFLHPHEDRDEYTDKEVKCLADRDFQTRLLMTSFVMQNNSVWVRNHHSDNVTSTSNFAYIRDLFKATFTTTNPTAAKATLTSELTKWFQLERDEYYTYATTLASGLSDEAENTDFEICESMVNSKDDLKCARRRLIVILDILFSKVGFKTFLIQENNTNIYRLAHCLTKHTNNNPALVYATFSFLLQLALTIFVVLEFYDEGIDAFKPEQNEVFRRVALYVLATLGAMYSLMVTKKEFEIAGDVYKFYGKIGLLQMIDLIVNVVLPVILLVAGYCVIIQDNTFIEAVLNTAALLFIPEIDDQLPSLLGYDDEAIIENYLIAESKKDYNKLSSLGNEDIDKKFDDMDSNCAMGVNFNDYYITNEIEQGSSPKDGSLYLPHIVVKNEKYGHEVDPSNYVTRDCLLKEIEWAYTTYNNKTTHPRVGYLKLTKLDGEEVEITWKGVKYMEVGESKKRKGVFVITNFVMSSGILHLRFCGSSSAKHFLKAFEYYSLWEIDYHAKKLLRDN
jgi:hypothetical protein